MLEEKVKINFEHLIVRGVNFITMCNSLTALLYMFYYFGWNGLVGGLMILLGVSSLNTLQYYTFFGWIYLRLRNLVISFTAKEDTWYRSDIQDNTMTIMIMIYVFALLLPFRVIFNTSFNALSDIFCAISNYIINSDDTCSISMYSVIVLMVKMWIVVCNIMCIWALLDTSCSAISDYSLKEIFGIIMFSLLFFGICFSFGNAFLCLSGIYVLIIPYFLYYYRVMLEKNRQDMKDLYGSEVHPDWVDETW